MMERILISIFTILCLVSGTIGKTGFGPGEQEWGFIQVRPGANMFWWLYYTTANVRNYYDKPLMIWLQGGPGASSTSIGNFEELGPLDINLHLRDYTLVKDYNVLFIDNPVGTGFSYVDNESAYATTNAQIANDLLECIRGFYAQLPEFKPVPTYIIAESYGGKMGVEFALVWDRAQRAGNIKSNLKGVALGGPWISPIDFILTWGPFLLSTNVVDTAGFEAIDAAAKTTKSKVETGNWRDATCSFAYTHQVVKEKTYNVDFYNILTKMYYTISNHYISNHSLPQEVSSLDSETICRHFIQRETHNLLLDCLMNGPVKKALGLNVSHGKSSSIVFDYLKEDIMKPVTNIVEQLLNETDLHVFVYNGQLDLLVNTKGTLLWVEKLKWKGADAWHDLNRKPLISKNIVEGYFKTHDNFGLYWVNRAGHMVSKDNPAAMEVILQDLISNGNNEIKRNSTKT